MIVKAPVMNAVSSHAPNPHSSSRSGQCDGVGRGGAPRGDRRSFVFAAWLPAWAGHDVLRLQYLAAPSDADLAPTLYSPEARALMAVIRSESLDSE